MSCGGMCARKIGALRPPKFVVKINPCRIYLLSVVSPDLSIKPTKAKSLRSESWGVGGTCPHCSAPMMTNGFKVWCAWNGLNCQFKNPANRYVQHTHWEQRGSSTN